MSAICMTSGKIQYATERDARDAVVQWQRRRGKDPRARGDVPRWTYRCDQCGCWHLTRVPPQQVRKGRRKGA